MVQRVELVFSDQRQQMRELESGDASRLEQRGESTEEVIDVWHMGQHVVGHRQVGTPAFGHQPCGDFAAEEHFTDVSPLARAASAVLRVGSMPKQGMSRRATYCNR